MAAFARITICWPGLTPDGNFVHVLEDDAVLARTFGPAMQTVLAGGLLEPFDIAFTETMVVSDPPLLRMLRGLFDRSVVGQRTSSLSLLDLKTVSFAGTTSFFVNPKSVDRIRECLSRGLAEGPTRPVDLFLREEVRANRLTAGLVFPFVSSVNVNLPSIIAPEGASRAVSLLLRNAFFVEADIAASRRAMAEISAGVGLGRQDERLELIADILRFMVSDKHRQF